MSDNDLHVEPIPPAEVYKAFEEVVRRNVKTTVEFAQTTRKIVRESQQEVNELKQMVTMQNKTIAELRQQITGLLVALHSGGTSNN